MTRVRTMLLAGLCGVAMAALSGAAHASWVQSLYTIDTGNPSAGSSNDSVAAITAYLKTINSNIVYLGDYLGAGANPGATPGGETITGTSQNGGLSGTWTSSSYLVDFFVVKAGPHDVLYSADTPSLTGSWSTADISVGSGQQPQLSHMDLWGIAATPVPEPASLSILGAALAILGVVCGVGRRRRRS